MSSPFLAPAPVSAVRHWAEHVPDQLAVVAEDGSYTFAELRDEMLAVAVELARRGIGVGDAVEIDTGQSCATAAAYLACWLTGATAVPIDPSTPRARLEFLRRDAGIAARIDASLMARATASRPTAAAIENLPTPPPDSTIAYLIYTSGTTGEPKGVEVTIANLNCLSEALRTMQLPAGGIGINPVSAAYDGWLWCFLLYLISGQRMQLLRLAAATSTVSAAEMVAAVEPTTVCVTPSILRSLDEDSLTAEVLVVAGEVCTAELVARFAPGRRMLNVYGPTETTIAATWADSARGEDLTTIGRPLPGYRVSILDPHGHPVAAGTVGELHIGGAGVAAGYRNRPGLTAARFLPHPDGAGRMYRTGDLAIERPDGLLEYRARDDGQVKVRGFRVEFAEIEAVALRCDGIRAAAAYLRADRASLGLAVVGAGGSEPDLTVLADGLAAELPTHLRPAALRSVAAIPLLSTGKIDRERLAAADRPPDRQAGNAGGPRTPTESRVLRVWRERLNRGDIGREDDFFQVGGHSLLAAQVVSALRRELATPLTVGDLFAHPTVAGVAAIIDQHAGSAS